MRAAAVRKYGAGLMASINSLSFSGVQRFAEGGLVDIPGTVQAAIPETAINDSGGISGQPLTLQIGGETFDGLIAPEEVAGKLVKFAGRSKISRSGRKPSWIGAS